MPMPQSAPERAFSTPYRIEASLPSQKELGGAITTIAHALDAQGISPEVYLQELKGVSAPETKAIVSIEVGFKQNTLVTGTVSVTPPAQRSPYRLSYIQRMDTWAYAQPGSDRSLSYLSNTDAVHILNRDIGERPFVSLMDTADISGTDIAHSITKGLYPHAKTRNNQKQYRISTITSMDERYIGAIDAELVSSIANHARNVRLGVSSTYATGFGDITKLYQYTIRSGRNKKAQLRPSGSGEVSTYSDDGVPKDILEAYARDDQLDNNPIKALFLGVDLLTASLLRQRLPTEESA